MRIAISHVGSIEASCATALQLYAPDAEYIDCRGDDQTYARLISERWTGEDALVIIEHDNEITADVLPSFASCLEPWCVYEYEIFSPPWTRMCNTGLGCVRFSADLQRKVDFNEHVLKTCPSCGDIHAFWGNIDVKLASGLENYLHNGPHVHGTIRHFHPYQFIEPDEDGNYPGPGEIETFSGGFKRVER